MNEIMKKKMLMDFRVFLSAVVSDQAENYNTLVTYFWNIDCDENGYVWALVAGYDGEDNLCAKIAYQSAKSAMQEYDIDWLMPCYKDGEVYYTETRIAEGQDFKKLAEWFLECYLDIKNLTNLKELYCEW